jgi:hypothetical protein
MLRFYRLAIPLILVFTVILAGCGGGGGSQDLQSNGSVRGTVDTTSLGSGANSVVVSLDGMNISAPMKSDGSFMLQNVPPGLHTMVVKANRKAGAMVVLVSGGKETNVGQMVLRGSGQIAGLVTDSSSGSPVSDALVTVTEMALTISSDTPHPVREAHTNSNGSYTVDAIPEGEYLVTISKDGFITATLNLYVSTGSTATGDTALKVVDPDAGSMQGVVDGNNADGSLSTLSGVFVVLTPKDGEVPPPVIPMPAYATGQNDKKIDLYPMPPLYQQYYAYTADDGTYQIDGIPAGDYTATAMRPGFDTATQNVTIAAKQSSKVNFTLTMYVIPTGIVSGTITDASTTKPIAGATVIAVIYGPCLDNGKPVRKGPAIAVPGTGIGFDVTATTDENGRYKLQVPTSTYAVDCFAEGYDQKEQVVTIVQDQTITVDMALTPTPVNPNTKVTLTGLVTEPKDSSGALTPSAGATVHLISSVMSGETILPSDYTATTDNNGAYTITAQSGNYYAYAEKGGKISDSINLRLYSDAQQDFELLLGIAPPPPPIPALK